MPESTQTRRRLLQTGAGALAAAAVARAGGAGPALAAPTATAANSYPSGLLQGEVRLFAGNFVPTGWERAPAVARGLMGSGAVPGGPTRHLGEKGDGAALHEADHAPSALPLTYLRVADPEAAIREMIGEVRAFSFERPPRGWCLCDGRELHINLHGALFSVLGTAFGGDGRATFAVPDLRSRTPLASGEAAGIPAAPFGAGRHDLAPGNDERPPRLHLNYSIALQGEYPTRT